jgi:hypothetical protein
MLDRLTVDDFTPLVGQVLQIKFPDHADTLTLIEAKGGRHRAPEGMRAPFSLTFRGENRSVMLGQSQYALDFPTLGRLDLLMVPIGPGADGAFRYQIVFG